MAKKAQRTGEYEKHVRIRPSFMLDESLCRRDVEGADPYRGNVRFRRRGLPLDVPPKAFPAHGEGGPTGRMRSCLTREA